ncbi:MAG: 2-oxo acid dehydrogenase subunit E2 [Bdellovibrionales bacterium]|nr:2-oxo acid dehydrogenase subunit E2 [Bdellovibrionales bacterium]
MATKDVNLPDIGEGVTEGELVQWLVAVGDSVEADQPIAEVMTDKATVEVPSPYAGTVKELKAEEGDVIPIETVMLVLNESGAGAAASAPAPAAEPEPVAAPAPQPQTNGGSHAPQPAAATPASAGASAEMYPPVADSTVLATPGTRRLAREMSVDINQLQGSGLAGRVTRDDVLSAKGGAGAVSAGSPSVQMPAPSYQGQPGDMEERVSMRGIRKKIAENMQMAKRVVPHFTLMEEVNVTSLVKMRTEAKAMGERKGVKVTYLPFVMKALIATLREFPMFNASIDDEASEIVYKKFFNIGFAADTPNGLLVPVIKNADQKTILQLSAEIVDLATRAREGKLQLDEMRGATMTITNIGSVGGVYATPIINHPEVAILGMYKMEDKPVMINGKFRAQKMMNYTITCDHRLIDGAVAANFMKAFASRIESPSALMLDMI